MRTKKLRLLLMLDGFVIGGVETYLLTVAKKLLDEGVSLFIAGRDGILKEKFFELGCSVYTNFQDNLNDFGRWIIANRINLVNAHHRRSGICAAKICKKLKIPFIFTVHFYDQDTLQQMRRMGVKTTFISVSIPIQKWLNRRNIPSILIPNGIDTKKYHFIHAAQLRRKLQIPSDAVVMVYASRLTGRKGKICKLLVKTMIERVLKDDPNIHLIVAGDGQYFSEISSMAKESKNIHLLGAFFRMPSLYSISNYVIGTGRVALEAMSCGRKVIAMGTQGIFGMVHPGNFQEAWRQYFGDHAGDRVFTQRAIEKNIKKALSSKYEKEDWGKCSREFIVEKFGISKVTKQLLAIYESHI